ncbi:PDDEXK nuclease domain-containing protein [Paraburkholderia phymatum]
MFDFLNLTDDAQERDIEQALTQHITRFLLELGAALRVGTPVPAGCGRR